MVVKNKLAWSSIEAVNRDFGSCLYDLQNFKMLYTSLYITADIDNKHNTKTIKKENIENNMLSS